MLNVKKMFLWVFAVLPMTSMGANNLQESLYSGDKSSDQVRNDVAKGLFVERGDVSVKVNSETIITEWNAEELFKEWTIDGFSLKNQNGKNYLTSGDYPSGAFMSATSKEIELPSIDKSEILFVQLEQLIDVESYYDEVSVYVLTDKGKTPHKVYAFTGKLKEGVETSFDVSKFAGEKVQFCLVLTSDESDEGKGWSIADFSLLKGENKQYAENVTSKLKALRSGETEIKLNLSNVRIDKQGNGSADFVLEDESLFDEYKKNQDNLKMTVNGEPVGCLNFFKKGEKDLVNIVYAIDNSGSMAAFQTKVASSIPNLIDYSVDLFNSYAALVRFGQDAAGCSVLESLGRSGVNIFDLSSEEGKNSFYRDENNSLWRRNVQTGSTEQYYAVLKTVASKPFQKVENKLLAVVLMGDESVFEKKDANNGDCDGGTEGFTEDDQEDLANFLKSKGVVVFVIQRLSYKDEYKTIVERTGGAFIDIESNYTDIADIISKKLKNHFSVTFCTQKYECGQTVLVGSNWNGETSETTTIVSGNISVLRDKNTEMLESVAINTPVSLTFDVKADEQCVNVKKGVIRYVYNDSLVNAVECDIVDGKISCTIPAEYVKGTKIRYNVMLEIEENDIQIGNPYVTHEDWAWELGIENDRPKFLSVDVDNKYSCQSRTFSAEITDNDGIELVELYYKTSLNAAFHCDTLKSMGEDIYSKLLGDSVGNGQGFYYYIVATDKYGLKANYGESINPMFMEFEVPENTDNTNSKILTFTTSRNGNCKPLKVGERGTFYFYVYNECGDLIKISTQEVIGVIDNIYSVSIPKNTNSDYKNGVVDGETVFVHFSYEDDNVEYDVTSFEYEDNGEIKVCVPEIIDSLLLTKSNVTSLRALSGADVVRYGDTINFGKCKGVSEIKFNVENDSTHYAPIVVNEIRINGNGNCFIKEGNIENLLIYPDQKKSFSIVYNPTNDDISEVKIYNSTRKQNPFVFYVKGEVDKTDLCKKLCPAVSVYDDNFVAQVNTKEHLSKVILAVKDRKGNIITSKTWENMGGPATQYLSLSTYGMDKNKEYALYVKVGDEVCTNAFVFNKKENEIGPEQVDTTTNDCSELIHNLSVNNWGTMIDVPVVEANQMMEINVYTINGTKTNVSFGPQLMGGPTTHSLYLGTSSLPAGSYIVRVKVGNKSCSRSFVNIK